MDVQCRTVQVTPPRDFLCVGPQHPPSAPSPPCPRLWQCHRRTFCSVFPPGPAGSGPRPRRTHLCASVLAPGNAPPPPFQYTPAPRSPHAQRLRAVERALRSGRDCPAAVPVGHRVRAGPRRRARCHGWCGAGWCGLRNGVCGDHCRGGLPTLKLRKAQRRQRVTSAVHWWGWGVFGSLPDPKPPRRDAGVER